MGRYPVMKFGGVTMQGQNSDWFRPDHDWLMEEANKAGKALQISQPASLTHFLYRLIERQRNLARAERLREICNGYILPELDKGNVPVVVVSAFDWATDKLVHMAECIVAHMGDDHVLKHKDKEHTCHHYICHEYARLLMSGELRANSALALTLNALGVNARSLTGREAGIFTRPFDRKKPGPTHNLIEHVDITHVKELIAQGIVPIVAGFQGYFHDSRTSREEVTTLDRGGSNLTAVALAHALGERECTMFSDVDAIYEEDPRENPKARKLTRVTPSELEAMPKYPDVILKDSVDYAVLNGINIRIRSGFKPKAKGTLIDCRAEAKVCD